MDTTLRKPNLIDAYRIIAAFAVIWYHSNYFNSLGTAQNLVFSVKYVLFYWAMAFFYTISAYLSLKSNLNGITWEKRLERIKKLLVLLLAFTIFHEAPRIAMMFQGRLDTYYPFHIFDIGTSPKAIVVSLIDTFRYANYSAAYYLFHLLMIYLYSIIVSALVKHVNKKSLIGIFIVCLITLFVLAYNQNNLMIRIETLLLIGHERALTGMLVGFIFALLNFKIFPQKKITDVRLILLLIMPILFVTLPNYLLGYRNILPITLTSIVFGFFLLYLGNKYSQVDNKVITILSAWGQKYSLGIFLLHPFTVMALDHAVPTIFNFLNLSHLTIIIYIVINLLGFYITMVVLKLLRKHFYVFSL